MRGVQILTAAAIAAAVLAGCSDEPTAQQREVNKRASQRQAYLPHRDVEFTNYNEAQKLYDEPSTIIWCSTTWGNPSAPIVTVPIAGKLTSSSVSFFPNAHVNEYDHGAVSVENRSVDGMYHGTPPPYRYGFTPGGQYVDFFNMPTVCTTALTKFQRQQTSLTVEVDQQALDATRRAEDALKRGDRQEAQRILAGLGSGK